MGNNKQDSCDWFVRYNEAYTKRLVTNGIVHQLRSKLHFDKSDEACLRTRKINVFEGVETVNSSRASQDVCLKNGADPLLWNIKACTCSTCRSSIILPTVPGTLYSSRGEQVLGPDCKGARTARELWLAKLQRSRAKLQSHADVKDLADSLQILPVLAPTKRTKYMSSYFKLPAQYDADVYHMINRNSHNNTAQTVRSVASIPTLSKQPDFCIGNTAVKLPKLHQ